MTTYPSVNLEYVPDAIRQILLPMLTSIGFKQASVDDKLQEFAIEFLCLDGTADNFLRVQSELGGGRTRNIYFLLVSGADAVAQAKSLSFSGNWNIVSWPISLDWLELMLVQAVKKTDMFFSRMCEQKQSAEKAANRTIESRLAFALNACGMYEFHYDLATSERFPDARDALVIGQSPANFSAALEIVHPDDRLRLSEAYENCIATGSRLAIEVRARLLQDSYRWIRSEGAVIDRTDQHPGHLVGVSWSIHEEQDAKLTAQLAKERLDDAMRTADMFSWEWNTQLGKRRLYSHNFVLDSNEGRDVFVEDLIFPDDLASDLTRFEHAITHAHRYVSEVRISLPGRPLCWIQLSADPKRSLTGEVLAMSGLGLDVTERHIMNEELIDARALLFDSLEAGRMYCWEWNLLDNTRRTIGPSRSILGTTLGSVDAAQAIVHPEDATRDEELIAAAVQSRGIYQNEFRILRPDGEIRWIQSRANTISGSDGKVSRVSGVAMDVSERRLAEQQLAGARKALDLALDAAKLNPWHVDLIGNLHSSGPRDAELFGEPITSVEQLRSMVVPEDRSLFSALRDPEFLASGQPLHFEYRIRLRNSAIKWIACHAKGVCDEHGVPIQLVGVSYDVSEARQAQEKLARSMVQLERVQSATNVVLWDWSRSSGIRCYQTGGIELSGAELPNVHPGDRHRVLRRLLACAATGEKFDEEFRLGNDTDEFSWIAMQGGRTVLGSKHESTILSGVIIDISLRKRAARLLNIAEDRLHRALDAAKMVCWEWRTAEASNDEVLVVDYSPKVAPCNTKEGGVVHPDDRERHHQAIRDALSGNTHDYRCEFRVVHPNGTITWLQSIGSRLFNNEGLLIGLTGVAIDINAQKIMEQALQESQEWQRMAVAAGELNLWRVDIASGQRQGGALDYRLFGFSPDYVGQVEDLIHPDDKERVDRAWNMSVNNGLPYDLDYRIVLVDGTMRWLRVRGKCMRDRNNGQPEMVGVTLDISEQVLAEAELREALEVAKAASEAKSAFLSSVSHELRTPLNGVIGFSELLMAAELDGTQHSHVHALNSSAHQLYGLINDVLDFSRIEAGEMPIEQTSFNLLECLEASMDMVASSADDKGLCLLMTCRGDIHLPVIGDPMRLRQVAANLLSNATKFTSFGMVSLELECMASENVLSLKMYVRDTGIGMGEEILSRLFQPFRQGDVSTTRRFGGTGLGLSISKRLIDLMNGSIKVSSVIDEGSCFEVDLDFALAPIGEAMEKPSLPVNSRIGVAVRSVTMRSGLLGQIQEFGANAELIDTSTLATRLNFGEPLDAIVIGLPMLDAVGAISHWPTRLDGTLVPVIVLVGIDQPLRPWFGKRGEKYIPVVRTLKPRQLFSALVEVLKNDESAMIPIELISNSAQKDSNGGRFRDGGATILIAEDNEINQTLLLVQLQTLGLTATLASDGLEVLEALRERYFDIILMDVEMPVMDGMEAASLIRKDPRYKDRSPYIIAITAHVLGDSRSRFMAAGMHDFISKPVIMENLNAALERGFASINSKSAPVSD